MVNYEVFLEFLECFGMRLVVSPVLNGFGCFYGEVYIVVNGVLEQGCFDMYCISISVLHHSCIFQ